MAVSGAWSRLVAACVLAIALLAANSDSAFSQITLRLVVTGLSEPVAFVQDPTNPSVQFVVQKGGRIRVLSGGTLVATDFLDLTSVVLNEGERGLLGLVFAPDYAVSRRFFVNFVNTQSHTVIARFKRSAGEPLVADADSRFDLRWPGGQRYIAQPFTNHKGGTLRFGPDGLLYIGMGDGGSGNDPSNNAQNPLSLLGKMLRVDVAVDDSDQTGYAIPGDNPFVDNTPVSAFGEIWAFGLRNPWKFAFDNAPGGSNGLFIGDVGQSSREEIDFEPAGAGGRNYGWRIREGTVAGGATPVLPAAYLPLTNPIYDYPRTQGQSVTGGVVYRGTQLAGQYVGRYVFGDFVAGRIVSLGLSYPGGEGQVTDVVDHTDELGGAATIGLVSSIDRDAAGEMYIVDFRGSIRRIERGEPLTLSVTGSGSVLATPPATPCADTCVRTLLPGTPVTLTPTAATGWAFAGWSGTPDCTDGLVTMDGPRSCSAVFVPRLAIKPPGLGADFNGDGRGDLFTYRSTTGAWVERMSGLTGAEAGAITGSWNANWTIRPGDFNADGMTDLFLYNRLNGQWFKALRTSTGEFTYTTEIWRAGWEVTVADLSGDGHADVLLYDSSTGQWFTCLTTATGGFTYSTGFWDPGYQVYLAQLDANNRADAFLYNPTTGHWRWAISTGTGGWTGQVGTWRAGWTVRVGDFNADGRSDIFLYDLATGLWFLCTNMGTDFAYMSSNWNAGWRAAVGDLDADGRSDVFLYNPVTGVWFQCLTVAGGFNYFTGQWAGGWEFYLADFDGDRRADVLLYNPSSGAWWRELNAGAGVFQEVSGTWETNLTPDRVALRARSPRLLTARGLP